MRLQVTLMLICLLFPEVQGLKCYECIPELSEPCTQTVVDCPDQCASSTTSSYNGKTDSSTKLIKCFMCLYFTKSCAVFTGEEEDEEDEQMKKCATSPECVSGSMNLGAMKISVNTKCCSTDLCNSQSVPALPRGSPNGRKCYTCDNNDCTGIVDCEGDEDHCVNIKSSAGNVMVTLKAVSAKVCVMEVRGACSTAGVSESVNCCQGNLCNGAESVNLSLFLLILGPLVSFIPFSSVPFSVFF
uniref:Snake toxin/toxin-like domain-containing protein n=1 Tax=Astyanax mexicanus TaxID=7994 RepID=A0A3B1KAW7_ASTMX